MSKTHKRPGWLDKLADRVVGPARPGVRARTGGVRENIEAFSVAIMGAVLLKFFAIEAFAIPTSSMQPTLMGSKEAEVYDRLLVDKSRYSFVDPSRWDVAVFRYPLQKNQNYVKRVVGMPGERITIGGGNVFLVGEDGAITGVLRRPDSLQEHLWKEVYPLRRDLAGVSDSTDKWWRGSPSRSWSPDGDAMVLDGQRGRTASLVFQQPTGGSITNDVYDGYPLEVARQIKDKTSYQIHTAAVQDVRAAATFTAADVPDLLAVELVVHPQGQSAQHARLEVKGGEAFLVVESGGTEAARSEAMPCPIEPGTAVRLAVARADDRLIAWRDGEMLGDLDLQDGHTDLRIHSGLARLDGASATSGVRFLVDGQGSVRVEDLRIERDIHYYLMEEGPEGHIFGPGGNYQIPDGHYFMMGDNTLQSVDSRGWQAITVGVLPDGRMVDPDGPHGADAERVRGNLRARDPAGEVDRDENPVVVPSNNTVSFIDEFGEIRAFRAGISPDYRADNVRFIELDDAGRPIPGSEWRPEQEFVPVVPREHMIGRALLGFWPFWPFGPNRAGFIR